MDYQQVFAIWLQHCIEMNESKTARKLIYEENASGLNKVNGMLWEIVGSDVNVAQV